jgi:hypothetical protein
MRYLGWFLLMIALAASCSRAHRRPAPIAAGAPRLIARSSPNSDAQWPGRGCAAASIWLARA